MHLLPKAELLNETLFTSLAHARVALECWRADYNGSRPHSKLGWKTPSEFTTTFTKRWGSALRNMHSPARIPAAQPRECFNGDPAVVESLG